MGEEEDEEVDPYRPQVGDTVVLTHSAIVNNINSVLKGQGKGVLGTEDTGVVLTEDKDSERKHFEVKNTQKGSADFGKTHWYQDITITKNYRDDDTVSSFMSAEEMSWAQDTIEPAELKRMLEGGLDLDHFMVMLAVGLLLKVIPGKVRARDKERFQKYSEAFESATDAFIQLDEGYGVLVLDGVEAKLKEAKAGDMVTKAKLKDIDEQNSGFVSYSHFLARFFHWMDPDLDDI